jgi:MraZ protein
MDAKGRIKLPAALKRQLDPASGGRFVINRGFEKCLVLYPSNEWEKLNARLNKLNLFEKKNRQFVRYFLRGATELTLDATDRLNIPNHLAEYADITKDLMLSARNNVIEVWNPKTYDELLSMDSDAFAKLAEDVMGDKDNPDEQ